MKKNWQKIGLGVACFLAAVGLTVGGVASADKGVNYASATEISCEILTQYTVGSSFTVPSATLVYDGENYEATDAALIFPDGVAKKGGTYTLLTTGEYTVVYTADCNGFKVRAEKKFSVTENNYTVSSDGSSVTYGVLQTAKVAGTEGLIVDFASGDSFRYSKPIDLTEKDVTDLIMMYPVKGGAIHNAGIYTVTLTDCYDPTVYVNLIITFNQEDWEYIRAGANGQDEVGLFVPDARHPGTVKVDGEMYYPHRNTYGASGKSPHMDPKGYGCRWLYNYAEQKVYLEERLGPKVINQFNHPDIYEEEQMFHGFTTGEVYLTLTPSAYNATTTQVEIESINGESGEALKLATDYMDDRAPTLKVDFKNVDVERGVYAAKGAKFKLFDATANDIHITGGVETKVYYNYGNAYQTSVLTEDGYFTPTKLGRYTLVYTAKDTFGNEAKQTVTVYCVETADGKGIQFSTNPAAELLAGKDNVLSEYTVKGLNDDVTVEIYAEKDGVKTSIDPETLVFVPLQHGEYEIVYKYFDSVYTHEYSYKVNSVASDEIRFLDEFVLPRHFIKDAYYSIENIFAYSFEKENPTAYKAAFMVSFDKGMFVEKNAEKVLIEGDSTVQFKFVYEGTEIVSEIYPIVDVSFETSSAVERYFVGEDISTEARGKAVHVQANKTSGNVGFAFVNPISLSEFDFRFAPPKSQANFSEFRIILTDYYNRDNQKVISYKMLGEGYYFSVGGGKDHEISSAYNFRDGEQKRVWYDALVKRVLNNYSMSVPFDFGFTTDMCLLDLEFVGISGDAAVEIKQINNQVLVNYGMDLATPSIGVTQSGGAYAQGTTVTIHRAYMTDILSPILTSDLTVSVEGPSGYLTSVDGVLLDGGCDSTRSYDVTLEEFGAYIVTYMGKDQNGLENAVVYRISVVDGEAPIVTFKNLPNGMPTVKVGKNYKIADYVVTDNYSDPKKVAVNLFVYDEHLGLIATDVKSFTPTQAGIYTIYAYCTDEAGNSSFSSYRVKAV